MTTHVNRKVVVVLTGHMEGGFLAATLPQTNMETQIAPFLEGQ